MAAVSIGVIGGGRQAPRPQSTLLTRSRKATQVQAVEILQIAGKKAARFTSHATLLFPGDIGYEPTSSMCQIPLVSDGVIVLENPQYPATSHG
jgi:hypothetical protein